MTLKRATESRWLTRRLTRCEEYDGLSKVGDKQERTLFRSDGSRRLMNLMT